MVVLFLEHIAHAVRLNFLAVDFNYVGMGRPGRGMKPKLRGKSVRLSVPNGTSSLPRIPISIRFQDQ